MTDHYHVLLDCKQTYTNKLIKAIRPCISSIIHKLYDEAKMKIIETKQHQLILKYFQDNLKTIKDWDNNTLTKEVSKICEVNKMSWLDELIRAIFIANHKIINIIHDSTIDSKDNIDININIPNTKLFIHTIYINISRELWKNPYLKYDGYTNSTILKKNQSDFDDLIINLVNETIELFLPVQHTLNTLTNHLEKKKIKQKKITKEKETQHKQKNEEKRKQESKKKKRTRTRTRTRSITTTR